MDLLQKELERKRKAIELAKQQAHIAIPVLSTAQHGHDHSTTALNEDGVSAVGKKTKTYLKAAAFQKFQQEQEEAKRQEKKMNNLSNNHKKRKVQNDAFSSDQDSSTPVVPSTEVDRSKGLNVDGCSSIRRHHSNATDGSTLYVVSKDEKDTNHGQENTSGSQRIQSKSHSKSQVLHSNETVPRMTSEEITIALRELGVPIRLFGETKDEDRLQRLETAQEHKKMVMAGMSDIDDFKLGKGHGIRNPFLGKDDEDSDDVLDRKRSVQNTGTNSAGGTAMASSSSHDAAASTAVAAAASVATMAMEIEASTTGEDIDVDVDVTNDPHKAIHRFFKLQLKQWEQDLVNRPEAVKRTLQGKNETKTLKQCKDYIRPLLKLCKNRRLETSMMDHLIKIVKYCQEGEFVKANDAYMDVAIGRAAWPIGVTMVGIHARSGRSKIESNNVAHVMNSEMQRKYLTSVKRLITYCQKKRTDVAPSKKVVNI